MKRIIIILSMSFFSFNGNSQTLEEVLNKHYSAIGGATKWNEIKTSVRKEKSIIIGGKKRNDTLYNTESIIENFAINSSCIVYGKKKEDDYLSIDILKNGTGWNKTTYGKKTEIQTLEVFQIEQLKDKMSLLSPLLNYKEKGYTIALEGKELIDNKVCYKIVVTIKNFKKVFYMDATTNLVIKECLLERIDGKVNTSCTDYSDFRKIDYGITIPFKLRSINEGSTNEVLEETLTELIINPNLDSSLFEKPTN